MNGRAHWNDTGDVTREGRRMDAAQHDEPLRVVVLTTLSRRGRVIIEALRSEGVAIHAVVLDRGNITSRQSARKFRRYLWRQGFTETWRRVGRRAQRMLTRRRRRQRRTSFASTFAGDVFEVADPNADVAVNLLEELAPDLIVLGRTRILKPAVLAIPPLGVLNPHPGMLPEYRGVDVISWALLNGDPLGVTIHFADPGIDTGHIVAQRTFDVQPGDTMHSLMRRADQLAGELMAKVVRQMIDIGDVEAVPQPQRDGRTYGRMPPGLRRRVEAQLIAQTSAASGR